MFYNHLGWPCEVEKFGQFIKNKIFYDVNTFRFLTQANMKYVKAWLFIASSCWDWLNHIIVFVLLVLETPPLLVVHHETPAQEQHGQKWSKVNLRQVSIEGFSFFNFRKDIYKNLIFHMNLVTSSVYFSLTYPSLSLWGISQSTDASLTHRHLFVFCLFTFTSLHTCSHSFQLTS